jgi:hypothetical protein
VVPPSRLTQRVCDREPGHAAFGMAFRTLFDLPIEVAG